MKTNMFKMRKPYDERLTKALECGFDTIDIRKNRKKTVSEWMYFLRKKKETRGAFDVKNVRSNIFILTPRKKIIHRKDKLNKRYSYFEIL